MTQLHFEILGNTNLCTTDKLNNYSQYTREKDSLK